MRDTFYSRRLSAGIPSFDNILLRSLPSNPAYLIEGVLGTERTTLATQFILEGKRHDEFCLSVTLSESNSLT
jgi:circadian clock protein KaiC